MNHSSQRELHKLRVQATPDHELERHNMILAPKGIVWHPGSLPIVIFDSAPLEPSGNTIAQVSKQGKNRLSKLASRQWREK